MGADIHGYWEIFHPEFNRWVMFKPINDTRKYSWFGIIAGVRGEDEPRVPVIMGPSADPSRAPDGSFSRMWVEYCKYWGRGLHSHAIVPWHSSIEANEMLWISDKRHWTEEDGPLEEWEGKNGRYRIAIIERLRCCPRPLSQAWFSFSKLDWTAISSGSEKRG